MIKKYTIAILVLMLIVAVPIFLISKDKTRIVPDGAFKIDGRVTSLTPNCEKTTYLQNSEVVQAEGPALCDGGSFIKVDDTTLQYQTGLSPTGFWYELEDIEIGDTVTAIYVFDENGIKVINCDDCGIYK